MVGAPAATAAAPGVWGYSGRLDLFVEGTNGQLYHNWNDGGWHYFEPLGGSLEPAPISAVSWGANRLDVFIDSTDNAVYHRAYTGTWQNWEQVGNNLTVYSPPAATTWGPNRLDVFIRCNPFQVCHAWYDGQWHNFEVIGNQPWTSAPAATAAAPGVWGASGRLDVYARGADYALYHSWQNGGLWNSWENLGGIIGG